MESSSIDKEVVYRYFLFPVIYVPIESHFNKVMSPLFCPGVLNNYECNSICLVNTVFISANTAPWMF